MGVVCPPQLKKDIFTTAACDNIDHYPTSTTPTGSFHGTAISLIQHPDPKFIWVEDRYVCIRNSATSRTILPLTKSYSNVPPVPELPKNYIVPPTVAEMKPNKNIFLDGKERTYLTSLQTDKARRALFTRKGRSIENIPPTSAALHQHILRTACQAGYVWAQAAVLLPDLPDPVQWGWTLEDDYHPFWTEHDEAAKSCYELIHCRRKNICTGRYKYMKANLHCSLHHCVVVMESVRETDIT